MWSAMQRRLSIHALPNLQERRQAHLLQGVLLFFMFSTLISLLAVLQMQIPRAAQVAVLLLTLLVLPIEIIALVQLRRGNVRQAVQVLAVSITLHTGLVLYGAGLGNGAVTLTIMGVPLVLSGLLAERRTLLVVAALNLGMFLLAEAGTLHRLPFSGIVVASNPGFSDLFGYITFLALMCICLDRFGLTLREALTSARRQADELARLRDSLEQTVADRTAELQRALEENERRAAEQRQLLEETNRQQEVIRELSVPVLPVSSSTLVMPLVGALDSARIMQVQTQALDAIARLSASRLLLDITGVPIVDSQVAQGLMQVVQAARLLGAEVVLVGLRPEVAQAIVGLGLTLSDVRSYSDLQSALSVRA